MLLNGKELSTKIKNDLKVHIRNIPSSLIELGGALKDVCFDVKYVFLSNI